MLGLFVGDQGPEKRIDKPGEDRLMKEKVGQTPYTSHVTVLLGQACLSLAARGNRVLSVTWLEALCCGCPPPQLCLNGDSWPGA